jgi:RNA polymerase sigma factor for flagellar operon FliA
LGAAPFCRKEGKTGHAHAHDPLDAGSHPVGNPRQRATGEKLMVDVAALPALQPPLQAPHLTFGRDANFGGLPEPQKAHGGQELILSCLSLVDSIARRVHGALPPNACVELHDLAQSGLLGLVSAGRGYDPATSVPFSVYARYRIEGEILDSLRRQDLAPRKLRRWQKEVSAARQQLAAVLKREPTEEELCDRLMISAVEMRSRSLVLSRTKLRCTPASDDSALPDRASGRDTDPDYICSQRQLRDMLDRLIENLPPRHQQVIRWHYGRHMSMKAIAVHMGVNDSRVSQMHRSALQAMACMLKESRIYSPADV